MDSLYRQAIAAEDDGQLPKALELWEELCDKKPTLVSFIQLGRARMKLRQWQRAEDAFEAALTIDKTFALAMDFLGLIYIRREDMDEATRMRQAAVWLNKSLAIRPSSIAYNCLGVTFHFQGDLAAAKQSFESAIQTDENFEEAYFNLAKLTGLGPEQAREPLRKAIQLDPNYWAAHQYLGIVEQKLRDFPAAEYHFRRAVELDPLDVFSRLFLANILPLSGNNLAAEAEYKAALAGAPEHREITIKFFAKFLDKQKRHGEAEELRQSIKSAPDPSGESQ